MSLRRRPRGRILAVLVAGVVVVAALVAVIVAVRQPAPVTARALRIAVTDGPGHDQHVSLDATFFTPPGRGRLPAILLAHGFGETKDAVRPQAEQLARDGFAVLTWSARGFGRSTGQVALDAPDYEVTDVGQLVSWLARQPRVVAVGETGLDYYRDHAAPDLQRWWFREHIKIAKRTCKALMIHDREAHADVLRILAEEGPPDRVVFHCFSGDVAMVKQCAEAGYVMSFAGNVTCTPFGRGLFKLIGTTSVNGRLACASVRRMSCS